MIGVQPGLCFKILGRTPVPKLPPSPPPPPPPPPPEPGFSHMRKQRREADQCLCFRYSDSTIHLLPKSHASSHLLRLYRPVFSQRAHQVVTLVFILILIWYHRMDPTQKRHLLSLVVRKPVSGVSDHVRHKPGCTTT